MLESEVEIGSSNFHAGEIACGFIEQLPENGKQPSSMLTIYASSCLYSIEGFPAPKARGLDDGINTRQLIQRP